MTSPLEHLAGAGKPLAAEPPDANEIAGLLRSGHARQADARNASLSLDSRFDLAYNAAHAFVDSVMIDTAFDGAVFNVAHADVPARKTDFVAGEYTLEAPDGETTVAVKITDMLGEEVLVTENV